MTVIAILWNPNVEIDVVPLTLKSAMDLGLEQHVD